jgi:fatty-acyl-CoA synthase
VACVAPVEEHRKRITREEILEFLRTRVAKWQLPDDVVFIEAVPKTSIGKFNKRALGRGSGTINCQGWKPRSAQSG